MATEPAIDFDVLLTLISDETPAGTDVREDYSPTSIFYQIKDAQASARANERHRRESIDEDASTEFDLTDWAPVLETGHQILSEYSKDMEIAVWYTESLMRLHGFAGMRDGFRLLHELTEQYWDNIFPRPDEDGVETTVASLIASNGDEKPGTMIWPITNIPLTDPNQVAGYGEWQYRQAQSIENLDTAVRDQHIADGAITLEMFEQAKSASPIDFYRNLIQDIEQTQKEFTSLIAVLDEKCGTDDSGYPLSPPDGYIKDALQSVLETVKEITKDMALEAPVDEENSSAEVAKGEADSTSETAPSHAGHSPSGILTSRADAYQSLQEISRFFAKTEPHSPICCLLQQAVRWGSMSFIDLYNELISDTHSRSQLFRLVGADQSTGVDLATGNEPPFGTQPQPQPSTAAAAPVHQPVENPHEAQSGEEEPAVTMI